MSTALEPPTLATVVSQWLDETQMRVDLAASTMGTYVRVGKHLQAWGKDVAVVGVVRMAGYVIVRREAGIAPRTIALELRVASAAFNWAQREGIVGQDARLRLPRLKIDPNRFVLNHRTPTPGEAARVIEAMPEDDWKLAMLILARTGARVGEVVALRRCDRDEEGRRVAFGAVDGACKTGIRWFPIDEFTARALRGRSDRSTRPLLDFGEVTAPIQALERRLIWACQAAEVARFTPHGLRRMVVSRLMRARVDPGTAAVLTGHSVQVMLSHYQAITDDDRRAAADQANLGTLEDPDDAET